MDLFVVACFNYKHVSYLLQQCEQGAEDVAQGLRCVPLILALGEGRGRRI